jgi:hypothetical protein
MPEQADPQSNPLLDAALAYAARGWPVFPLTPGGRVPLPGTHGFKDASVDREQIRAWWAERPNANIGIRTGKGSAVVVDVDRHGKGDGEESLAALEAEHGKLPTTWEARTPRQGRHLYFDSPDLEVKTRTGIRPGLDIKGDGGYVVAPPSVVEGHEQPYVKLNGHGSVSLPQWIADLANAKQEKPSVKPAPRPPAPAHSSRAACSHYAEVALKLEIKNLRQAAEGTRNDTLNKAAFNLGQLVGGGYLDRARVESELSAAAAMIGLGESETAGTIRSGIEAGVSEPRTIQPRPIRTTSAPSEDESAAAPDVPNGVILIPGPHTDDMGRYVEQSSKDFADQVIAALPVNLLYRKGHIPGELIGQTGSRHWSELVQDRARLIVDQRLKLAAWHTRKDGEAMLVYKPCNRDNAGLVIAGAQQDPRVRDLELLVHYPVYGPGFQRVRPGWHDGIFYDEPEELRGLEPETDIRQIQDELHELLVDFPFKDEASRQNFIGLLLTPLLAPAIDGNRPLHLLLSPLERTGKTKLAEEVFGGVILGRETPALQITDRDEERDKRLLALLLQGETIVHLDNLPPTVDSAALASILTATTYQGRILGASRIVCLPNTLTVVGSGNNTECSGEIAKRTVPIQLQPRTAHPEARRDFAHPNLRAHVKQSRRRILSVLLGMIENWLAQGRPLHKNRFGGFETWSETIGGILHANCFNKWRSNEEEWRKSADPVGQEWEAFVSAWWKKFGKEPTAIADLMQMADELGCFQAAMSRKTERGRQVAFGSLLRRRIGMPVGSTLIRRQGYGTHSNYYLEGQR